jgi:hypothetical protein
MLARLACRRSPKHCVSGANAVDGWQLAVDSQKEPLSLTVNRQLSAR